MSGKHKLISQVADRLHALNVLVHELVYRGNGRLAFKITTPLHTYLDVARPEEIIALAEVNYPALKGGACRKAG
jgi:hypothetical protein